MDIEALRKEAWKHGNVQRDTKKKACEYSLLMFRLDTLEDTIRCMKHTDNRNYGIPVIFQITEHTSYGIQLLRDNKPVYPYNVQYQMREYFIEIQEAVINYQYDKAITTVKNIRNITKNYIAY